jgi:serine phosphatase RsbU (regulator of sigma subunit)
MLSAARGRRIAGVAAGLALAGACFAPAALSDPGGAPPGQAKKLNSNATSSVPPGQAKKLASNATSSGSSSSSVHPGPAKKLTSNASSKVAPGQSKKLTSNAKAKASSVKSKTAAGQAKKLASNVTSRVTSSASKLPSGQGKKLTSTPSATSTSPPSAAPAATPSVPTATKHKAGPHRSAKPRRTTAASRSRARARARQVTATRVAAAANARSRLSTSVSPAVGTGTSGSTSQSRSGLGQSRVAVAGRGAGRTAPTAGPLSSISNLLPVPLPVPDWSKPIILLLVLLCILLGLRVWLSSRRAHRLDLQRRRLTADLDSLQPALVPDIPALLGPLAVSVAYSPAEGPAAGGDFYDAFALEGDRVAILVGDVSGHGRAALTRAAHMRYTLRAYMETGLDPRSALKLAGRVLGADAEALFTTVGIAVYDAQTSTLTYAAAGHPAPILLGPGAHEPLTTCASPALGWGAPTGRRQTTVPFSEGARACFFSDGVTEVRTKNGLLGRQRLAEIAAGTNPAHAATELLECVQHEASTIRDDMAACIVEATTGAAVSDHRIDQLEVEPRHLESGQGERFLAACGVPRPVARETLDEAAHIAAETGSALLRVEIGGPAATATALRSGPVSLAIPASLSAEHAAPSRARPGEPAGPAVTLS